jgi:hypothetical protein
VRGGIAFARSALRPHHFLAGIRVGDRGISHAMTHTRRQFIRFVPTLGAFSLIAQPFPAAPRAPQAEWPAPPIAGAPVDDFFPSLHPSLMKDVVGLSHSNLARVKEMVQQHPALAKASWDWGHGDHETALGAASHVGQRAIAEHLLENGAPPTLFSATMLGQLELVKAFMATTPGLQKIRGPHSLSLMVHAKAGGPPAAAVVAYLESIGDAALPLPDAPLSVEERAMLDGRYVFGDRSRDSFTVETKPNQVSLVRAGASARFLRHLGRLEFAPPGAPAARIRFEREGERVVALTIADPDLIVRAKKA